MQLNYGCIRAILLYFQDNLKLKTNGVPIGIQVKDIENNEYFSTFTKEDVHYTVIQLVKANYLIARKKEVAPRIMIIEDITWQGHEFISASRNDSNWKKAMAHIKNKGEGITLEILKQLLIQFSKDLFLG